MCFISLGEGSGVYKTHNWFHRKFISDPTFMIRILPNFVTNITFLKPFSIYFCQNSDVNHPHWHYIQWYTERLIIFLSTIGIPS